MNSTEGAPGDNQDHWVVWRMDPTGPKSRAIFMKYEHAVDTARSWADEFGASYEVRRESEGPPVTPPPVVATGGAYEALGREVGKLVDAKNAVYGDSFNKCADYLSILYPEGVSPEKYKDMLCLVRIFDKAMRIATSKKALGESPYRDISGYGLLGLKNDGE